MADDIDLSEEGDALDLQAFKDSQAAARMRDDQVRFAQTAITGAAGSRSSGGGPGTGTPAPAAKPGSVAPGGSGGAPKAKNEQPGAQEMYGTIVKGLNDWATKLPRNIGLGMYDAAVSMAKAPFDIPEIKNMLGVMAVSVSGAKDISPNEAIAMFDTFDSAHDEWRAELSSEDSMSDTLTQGVAQFTIPFTGFMRAFGVSRELGVLNNGLRLLGADAAASATAFEADAGRAADLIQLGLHAENKFGDVLRTLAPDGSLQNQYIEWMTEREGETALEGRFKNTVDALGVSAALGGIVKTAGTTFKLGRKAVVEGVQRLRPVKSTVEAVGPKGGRETHTGLVFEDLKDAESAVEELAHQFGPGFEERLATAHAKASDKNFATLHSFANVLKSQVDKPVKTASLIDALEKNLKGDTEIGAFYKELMGRLKAKNLGGTTTVKAAKEGQEAFAGKFNLSSNSIDLLPLAFEGSPDRLLHTFAHEAVHKATTREMRESPTVASQMERLRKRVERQLLNKDADAVEAARARGEDVNKNADKILTFASRQDEYGFKNAEEFVAEIESNPRFRKVMQETLIDGESAWDKYLKTIAGILGIGGLATNPEFSKLMDPQVEEEDTSA